MSIDVPTTRPTFAAREFATGEDIDVALDEIVEGQHWAYAYQGMRLFNLVYFPSFQTATTSYTTAPDNAVRPLDHFTGACRPLRHATGDVYLVRLKAHIAYADLEWTVKRLDDDGTETALTTQTLSATTPAWTDNDISLASADVRESGSPSNGIRPILHTLRIRATDTDPATNPAELSHATAYGKPLEAGEMP